MSRYPRHDAVVKWAIGELGVHEDPPGSNTGNRVRYYQSHTWLPGTRWPWCAAFADTAWEVGGGYRLPFPSAGAHDLGNRAKAAGWVTTIEKLIPGDLLDWNVGSGHLSIFLGYDAKNRTVKSIDGNVSDQVAYRERPLSAALRYAIHVPEKPTKPLEPAITKPPRYIVTTSEAGTSKIVYVSGPKAVARKLADLVRRFGTITIRRKPR